MAILHLPQFKHEPVWQYLSRLNDYGVQYVHFMYEILELCIVVFKGITYKTRAIVEFRYYGGMCYLNVNDMWDLFESLAWYQWQCNSACKSFVCSSPLPYVLHA